MDDVLFTHGMDEILKLVGPIVGRIPTVVKRKRATLLQHLDELDDGTRLRIADAARQTRGTKRKAKSTGRTGVQKRPKISAAPDAHATPAAAEIASVPQAHVEPVVDIVKGPFLEPVSEDVVHDCISRYIDRTGNAALRKHVCMVCARRLFRADLEVTTVEALPHKELLKPSVPHPAHVLTQECLLHPAALVAGDRFACSSCLRKLRVGALPPYALANGMWLGDTPFQLSVLTLPERLLVALYLPAAYVVKLYPKVKGAREWNKDAVNSGMKGNVSTYRLNTAQIAGIAAGNVMPLSSQILAATIGVTFVGAGTTPLKILPDFLRVRRQRVFEALVWLRANNGLYANIEISQDQLRLLPEDAVPDEIVLNAKYSNDIASLEKEQAGYIPADVEDEDEEEALLLRHAPPNGDDVTMQNIGQPSGEHFIEDDVPDALLAIYEPAAFPLLPKPVVVEGAADTAPGDPVAPDEDTEPVPFPLQAMGVVDAHAEAVPDNDLFAHAFANVAEGRVYKDFAIRKSSAFVNEYPRLDDQNQRFDGGPDNPNLMLGAFPVLFPYGQGGIEVGRSIVVPYESHVRWALQYDDAHFRMDLYFIFQAFGVLQKRQVCRSSGIQIKRSSFMANQVAFLKLGARDFIEASHEETRRVPFSNPVIRKLRKTLTSVRTRVQGTDESRISIRSQVWGTNMRFNPLVVWATWNMADCADPMAQVLVGEEIDMDAFLATAGPSRVKRATNIAGDPYAAAEFFHRNVGIILEEVLGIKVGKRGYIERKPGILGVVNAYIGTVEAQARGTLHLHIMFWLDGAPTAEEMRAALQNPEFREKMIRFIKQNIRADIKGTDARSVMAIKKDGNIAYSRPVDPRKPDYERLRHDSESRVARAVQTHKCTVNACLRTKDGRLTCKRRAPWPLSSEDWVEALGEWGPRRVYGRMNAWNPALLQIM
ncbi:hypothetical protein B0H15DRAFT_943753 [Mycena belliarum]|uniref:Helitron helicase-like domain-containing protein n=1 Tax=Mycena belliarum TaxID=1033014 RepID=A0AAD6UGF6_9AGAR|nr:hypothetical protein B0H15DRAFT_943753 [Mycena belliae]